MHPPVPTARRAVLIGAAALALALLPAAPALAHDELVAASPAAGSTVTALQQVDLTFAEPLVQLSGGAGRNGVVLLDAAGRHYETACASVRGDHLVAPVALGAAGTYRVQWRGLSDDGHVVGATYAFTWRPAAGTTAASGSATGPSCGATASEATAAPTDGTSIALLAGGIGGAVLLVVVVAVVVVALRLRRSAPGAER